MTEPVTPNIALISPLTGDLPGAWGTAAMNPNFLALDGLFGGVQTISLSSATTVALTLPSGSLTPGAGPNQSQNALLKLSGTLSGNCVLKLGMPGKYIIDNRCTVGAFYVQMAPSSGTGTVIGIPDGEKIEIFYDGTNVDYVGLGRVASPFDLHGATTVPAWITACSVLPYLLKDGSVYSTSVYPALGAKLGSTFGGNGITTFGVPDERARARIAFDPNNTGRLTAAASGVNGATMGAAGGNQLAQTHTHGIAAEGAGLTQVDFGAAGRWSVFPTTIIGFGDATIVPQGPQGGSLSSDIPTKAAFAGNSQNVQPSIVSFLPLIKT